MIIGVSIGMLLLSLYLILVGLTAFVPAVANLGKLLPILALLSGICILIGR